MRLLPGSLFGRLMLILVLGLILAQVVSTMLLLRDRDERLRERFGLNLVQRIGAVVSLIEESPAASRDKIINAFDAPGFRVAIGDRPVPPLEGAISADHLSLLLQQQLPDHSDILVSITPLPHRPIGMRPHMQAPSRPGWMRPWHRMPGPLIGFQASVRLLNGAWINFQRPLPDDIRTWPKRILAYLGVLLLSIIALSLLAIRIITRPLETLSSAAEQFGRNIRSPPLNEGGPTEVRRAAVAFNTMQRRLRRFIEDRGQILAAVSHDLKTPITRLRLRTELLEESDLKDRFSSDLDDMEQMVSATLDFMRGTESAEQQVSTDIPALLESLQDDMHELGAKVIIEPAEGIAPYPGRPLALKRCLGNLLENAVRYGGEARVRLQQTPETLTLIIADPGPGVPEAELAQLFRPFYRREGSRSKESGGTGLGLGIARNIARSHGGEVVLRPGRTVGLEAVVTLPRSR